MELALATVVVCSCSNNHNRNEMTRGTDDGAGGTEGDGSVTSLSRAMSGKDAGMQPDSR